MAATKNLLAALLLQLVYIAMAYAAEVPCYNINGGILAAFFTADVFLTFCVVIITLKFASPRVVHSRQDDSEVYMNVRNKAKL
ncbi:hypothetical protein CRUP_001352 [Coryphaenoides rupestris]|nr:hypothetical protein CRUP_001352 [Coryphaenoides rupestris]